MDNFKKLYVEPGSKVDLSKFDPNWTAGLKSKKTAQKSLKKNLKRLKELQYQLYAEDKRSVLVVLQGIDAAGKDGTIRHVMGALNPQGCPVTSFKVPSKLERDHDFLWRIHKAVPPRGEIGIFNRSHYEDVLVVRVHELVQKSIWSKRYAQINDFEEMLAENDVTILKFFLYIDRDEQKKRFQARLDDPTKNWKFNPGDLEERKLWDKYIEAYETALTKCSKTHAPWHIIPANNKWFRNLAVSTILADTLEGMKLKMPKCEFDVSSITID